jgi:FkbM family methyltransferase
MNTLVKNAGRRAVRLAMKPALVRAPLRHASKQGLLPGWLWGRLPIEAPFEVDYGQGIRFRYQPTAYDGIGRQLYWKGEGHWEHETLAVYCRMALRARRVLDIGANTGTYSLIACAAHPDTRVTAFEPVPRIRAQLEASVALNGFGPRCEVRNDAVSDRCGTARFHVPAEALPTSSSLHPDGFRGLEGEHIEVPLTTVDALLEPDDAVDLVKIDVEGFEHTVLAGMERTIAAHRPAIFLECNHDGPVDALEAIIAAHGLWLYHLRPSGPERVPGFGRDASDEHRNFLALPPEREGWLEG